MFRWGTALFTHDINDHINKLVTAASEHRDGNLELFYEMDISRPYFGKQHTYSVTPFSATDAILRSVRSVGLWILDEFSIRFKCSAESPDSWANCACVLFPIAIGPGKSCLQKTITQSVTHNTYSHCLHDQYQIYQICH